MIAINGCNQLQTLIYQTIKLTIMKNLNLTFVIVLIATLFFASCADDTLMDLPEQTTAIEHFEAITITPDPTAQQIEFQEVNSELESRSLEVLFSERVYVGQNGWVGIYISTSSLQEGYRYNAYATPEGSTQVDLYAMAYNPHLSGNKFRTVRMGTPDYGALKTHYVKHDFTSNESRAYFYVYGKRGGYIDLTIEKELIYGGNGDNNGNGGGNNNTPGTLIQDDFESYANSNLRGAAHWGDFMISYNYASVGEGYDFGYNSNKALQLQNIQYAYEPTAALLKLGNPQSGTYSLSWKTFVSYGGSYSFQAPGGIHITLNTDGTATATLGNAQPLQFRYTQGRWCTINMKASLNNGYYELLIDNTKIRFTNPHTDNRFNEVEFMAGSEVISKIDNILVQRN